jgi:hypothetical protein
VFEIGLNRYVMTEPAADYPSIIPDLCLLSDHIKEEVAAVVIENSELQQQTPTTCASCAYF